VVVISYTDRDPEVAARIANEFARAYIADQNVARGDVAQAGSSWLRERLREVGPRARVIAEALPPQDKSNIRGILIIAVAGISGGLVACSGALLWKMVDRRVTTPEELSAATGLPCLGIVPRQRVRKKLRVAASAKPAAEADKPAGVEQKQPGGRYGGTFKAENLAPLFVLEQPRTEAWHTVRNVVAACQDGMDGKGLRYLAVTSTFSGEGRSTIAVNLALALATSNASVLLVDCDIYDPGLSAAYAGQAHAGLIDYLRNPKDDLAKYVLAEEATGLHFLPIGGHGARDGENIWTEDLERFFAETTAAYDHVIFDVPTVSAFGDIRASARYLNGFLLVAGWRKVTADALQVAMQSAAGVSDKVIGSVLNNVNTAKSRWTLSPQMALWRKQRARSRARK
jgi:succinoglycan biosynthesis transport protein ExoP